jgi:hypothetical protein
MPNCFRIHRDKPSEKLLSIRERHTEALTRQMLTKVVPLADPLNNQEPAESLLTAVWRHNATAESHRSKQQPAFCRWYKRGIAGARAARRR